ncbi:ankyrin repeat-containing domain protein [Apodospora peruviana]|uniref:Ankyrin repeat-containing domain protein n=1 Tax=Apodospora peruviana TaxID=516989 RepID=A0AAE0ICR1_9PEZI|nr:ankyrin repeat-containing domain protein [Apodospora peruviana]
MTRIKQSINPANPPAAVAAFAAQFQHIIDENDKELARLTAEFGALKDALDARSVDLKRAAAEKQHLEAELQTKTRELQEQIEENMYLQTSWRTQEGRGKQHELDTARLKNKLEAANAELAMLRQQQQQPPPKYQPPSHMDELRALDTAATMTKQMTINMKSSLSDEKEAVPVPPPQEEQRKLINPALNVLDKRTGGFPLYGAAAGGHYDEAKRMLEQGADASLRTRFRWTALHWAAGNGHPEVVRLLLQYGADVNAVSDTGKKPLGMAASDEIREMLLAKGATQ